MKALSEEADYIRRKGGSTKSSLRLYCQSCRTTTQFQRSKRTGEQGQSQSYEVNRRASVAASLAGSSLEEKHDLKLEMFIIFELIYYLTRSCKIFFGV